MALWNHDREKERRLILRYYSEGLSNKAIARHVDRSACVVERVLREEGLRPNPSKHFYTEKDPTPEEIAERAAEIRKGWGPQEYEQRAVVTPERRTWADRAGAWEAIESTNARSDLHRDDE